jgi:acid phosphatase type 7
LNAANADRANHPFIIVVSHRGMFSTSLHSNDSDVLSARSQLAPIYDKYHVDMVFNGHDHEYERSKPVKAGANPSGEPIVGATPADGTVYVICAGAGADPYQAGQYNSDYRDGNATGFGGTTAYVGVYGILTISSSSLALKSYGLKSAGGSVAGDDVIDTFEIDH